MIDAAADDDDMMHAYTYIHTMMIMRCASLGAPCFVHIFHKGYYI
jgi:hypothetical protein